MTLHCPPGFVANGLAAGIKPSGRPDLALVCAPEGATAAALLTTNAVRAAPLTVSARHLAASAGDVRALLVNAGCANAATGAEGERRCLACVEALALALGCAPAQVLVNSTGVIGVQLPFERLLPRLTELVAGATGAGLESASTAILTTDTRSKSAEVDGPTRGGARFRVVGFAKGAGMIHPSLEPAVPMATMIMVILTDAACPAAALQSILVRAAERSVHRISVDGDTSTNDAVFALASGKAGAVDPAELERAVAETMRSLALQIARDGEGATKLITVRVRGAADRLDALVAARTVASSMLVRTAVAGGDPNWGRIVAALGRSGARMDLGRLAVVADGVLLFSGGGPVPIASEARATIFKGADVEIAIDLGIGAGADEFHTCDLTEEYVRVNAEYTT